MRSILNIARNDLRVILSERSIWINLLFVPLIISYVIGIANGAGSSGTVSAPSLPVDVVQQDQGALVNQFLSDIRAANPNIVLCPMDNALSDACKLNGAALDESRAEQRLKDETSLALIVIPSSFTTDLNAGKGVNIVYRSNESATAPSYILQAVQAAAQKLGGAQIAAQVGANVANSVSPFASDANRVAFADQVRQRASDLWSQNPVTVNYVVGQQPASDQSGGGGFSQSIPGIGSMYVLFTIIPAGAAIIAERKNWTLPRLAVLPISRAQILGGKLLARFAMGMMEYGIMFSFGLVLGVRYGSDPLALILLMIAFTLCVTSLTLALTGLLHNEGQARGIGLFLTMTLCPLGGAWWPLDIVPQWMATLGHISPVAWAMDGFHSLIFNGGSLGIVIVPLAVLFGMTAVFFVYGIVNFKFTD